MALNEVDFSNHDEVLAWLKTPEGVAALPEVQELVAQFLVLEDILHDDPAIAFIPNLSQQRFFNIMTRGGYMFMGNQGGKSAALTMKCLACSWGFYPWLCEDDPEYHVRFHWMPGKPRMRVPNIGRLYITDYKKWNEDLLPVWEEFVPRASYNFIRNSQKNVTQIDMDNGSVIYIKNREMDDMTHEGGRIDWVAFNEPPKEQHWKAGLRGLMRTNGPHFGAMTLLEDEPWVYEKIYEKGLDPAHHDITAIEGFTTDNLIEFGGVLSKEGVDDFADHLTEEEYATRILGRPMQATGRIFREYEDREPWCIDPIPLKTEWPSFFFMDPHDDKPDACLWVVVDPDWDGGRGRMLVVQEIFDFRLRTTLQTAKAIHAAEKESEFQMVSPYDGEIIRPLGVPRKRWMDPAGTIRSKKDDKTRQQDYAAQEIKCGTWPRGDLAKRIKMARDWLIPIKPDVEAEPSPMVQVFKPCVKFRWEMGHWFWNKRTGKPDLKNNDLLSCFIAATTIDMVRLGKQDAQRPSISTNRRLTEVLSTQRASVQPKSSTGY